MSNGKEVKIIIAADGSEAIKVLQQTSAAVAGLGKSGKQIEPLDKGLSSVAGGFMSLDKQILDVRNRLGGLQSGLKEVANNSKEVAATMSKAFSESSRTEGDRLVGMLKQLQVSMLLVNDSVQAVGRNMANTKVQTDALGLTTTGLGRLTSSLSKDMQALAQSTGNSANLLQRARSAFESFRETSDKFGEKMTAARANFANFTTGLNQGLEILGKAKRAFDAVWEVSNRGAQFAETKQAFDDFTRSLGISSDELMQKLRKSSAGTINDFELMKTASLAMSLGVTQDSDKMSNLLEIARNKARLFGVSTQQAFEDIVTGIGRASPKILDNLGIRIPAAFEQMTDGMSDAEKVAKLFDLTLQEGNIQLEAMGGLTNSTADDMRAFSASVDNLKTDFGELVALGFGPFTKSLRDEVIPALRDAIRDFQAWANVPGAFDDVYGSDLTGQFAKQKEKVDELRAEAQELRKFVDNPMGMHENISSDWWTTETTYAKYRDIFGLEDFDALNEKKLGDKIKHYLTGIEGLLGPELKKLEKIKNEMLVDSTFKAVGGAAGVRKALNFSMTDVYKGITDATAGLIPTFSGKASGYARQQKTEAEREAKEAAKKALEDEKNLLEAQNKAWGHYLAKIGTDFQKAEQVSVASLMQMTAAVSTGGMAQSGLAQALSQIPNLADDAATSLTKIKADNLLKYVKDLKSNISVPKTWVDLINQLAKSEEELEQQRKDRVYNRQTTAAAEADQRRVAEREDFYFNRAQQQIDKLSSVMRIDIAESFEGGLYDAMNGGNFFESFGRALRSQVTRAFAASITSRLFGSGGVLDIGGMLMGASGGASMSGVSESSGAVGNNVASGGIVNKLFKPILDKDNKVIWSALGQNLAIGGAVSFLTSPGRLFGGSVIHGQENFNTSSSLNDQVTQAKELRDQLYIQAGITEATRKLLEEAQFAYTSVRKTKSGNGITSKKTTTYLLEGSAGAQASINNIKSLQEAVMGEQATRSYDLWQLSRNDSVKALQLSADDAKGAYDASLVLNTNSPEIQALRNQQETYKTLISNTQLAISQQTRNAQNNPQSRNFGYQGNNNYWQYNQINSYQQQIAALQAQIDALAPSYKYSEAERTAALKAYEQAKIDLVTATESGRTNLMSPFLSNTTLASLTTSDILSQMLGDKSLSDSSGSIQAMLPLLKQAGMADMNIAQMYADAGSDPTKLYDAGKAELSNLEKALAVYEQIWKDAEQEALDASKTIEEQNAAFERFQTAQDALLQTKDAILQKEQELAAIEKQKLESQRNAQIDTALSAIGELDKRGDRMIILSDNDAIVAIDALLEEFKDNPEVTAILQKKRQTEVARAKWGSMG